MEFLRLKDFYKMLLILLLPPLIFLDCSTMPGTLANVLDTPEHHVLSGFKLMEKKYLGDAEREFELALKHNPNYSPAHRGMGLVQGMKRDFGLGFKSMHLARDYAVTKEDEALAHVGFMRLYTMQKEKGWLKKVEGNFSQASLIVKTLPEAYFQMGIAYKQANRFPESERAFKMVLEINQRLVAQANEELKSVQKPKQD